jgi:large subunit ribosomal protein L24
MVAKRRIKKGDEVVVRTGRDRGKIGDVIKITSGNDRITVQGVAVAKRHTAPSANNPGGVIDKEMSIHISNVSLLDPKDRKPAKVGYKILEDGRKVRFSKRSGEVLDR